MYLFHYDFGGMTSQVMTSLVAQTVADLSGLKYIHIPNKQSWTGNKRKHWQKFLQWNKYSGIENDLPEPPVRFIIHFFPRNFKDDGGAYSMRKFMLEHFEKDMHEKFELPPGEGTYEVRVHKSKLDLSLFEKEVRTVHVLLENNAKIDFTENVPQALVCTHFAKIQQLFLQSLKTHPIAKRTNKRVVHVAIHLRTGDLLHQARGGIFDALKKGNISGALDLCIKKIFYQIGNMQVAPLVRSVVNTLECKGVLYKVSLYTLESDSVLYDFMRQMQFTRPTGVHIGGNMMDTFVQMASSDIIIAQSGGFARLAGLLGGKLVLFSRNRPAFLSKYISLLSAQSPLFDKNQTWALSTPLDLFRLRRLINEFLDNKRIL